MNSDGLGAVAAEGILRWGAKLLIKRQSFNPRPAGPLDFPPPAGGGGGV